MDVHVLGPLEVLNGDVDVRLGGPKQRTVLALLAAEVGKPVSVDTLIDGVWGDEPTTGARSTLQTYVSNLRAAIGDVIVRDEGGYQLVVDPGHVDAVEFERAVEGDIQQSRAEFCVAQNMYVATRNGWISDRSLCYLTSGKPVLAQDTGFSDNYPVGEGLIPFSTLDEAAAGVEEIEHNYERHSKAARELAEEYFDSRKVLSHLLARFGMPVEVQA